MSHVIKLLVILFIPIVQVFGQTAVNFNATDCNGVSHDLFSELDDGKVIVLCWVMPCYSCIQPSKTTYNKVNEFSTSHPNKVHFYLCDDFGTTNCQTLEGWATDNGMSLQPFMSIFSDSTIKMMDYGSNGMPKIVVVGGSAHTVFYNANNTVDVIQLESAINNAIAASGFKSLNINTVAVYPNPAQAFVNITIPANESGTIRIMDMPGRTLMKSAFCEGGELRIGIDALKPGAYVVEIQTTGKRVHQVLVRE